MRNIQDTKVFTPTRRRTLSNAAEATPAVLSTVSPATESQPILLGVTEVATWQSVEAISSAVGTIVLIIASWIALRQWRESLSARQIQGALALIEQLQQGSTRETREYLLRHHDKMLHIAAGPRPLERLDKFIRRNSRDGTPRSLVEVRKNLAVLEFVAILCLNGQLPIDFERSYLAPIMARYWEAAEPIVIAIRKSRGSEIYLQHVEALVTLLRDGRLFQRRAASSKKMELKRVEQQSKSATRALFNRPQAS